MALEAIVSQISRAPRTVGAFFDFDGTLSPICDDPESVQPLPGVVDSLTTLADSLGVVAIVSGRPVSFLERIFPNPDLQLSGLYGLEHRSKGELRVDEAALEWSSTVAAVVERATVEFGIAAVEDKRYSITVHYRRESEEFADRVHVWAEEVAADTGLEARGAKQSVEIHPPIVRSKGDAVEEMLEGVQMAGYFGDDLGDRPAFERLASLATNGSLSTSARVLVTGPETPSELHEHATDVVQGPKGAYDAIMDMVAALPGT